jgi:hypothetical protein
MERRLSLHKSILYSPLNLGTAVFILAWLALACYAITYLLSH